MRSPLSVRVSVRLFSHYLWNRLTVDLELLHMSIGHDRSSQGLEVKVMGQANAVGPTSMEGSFYRASSALAVYAMIVCLCLCVCVSCLLYTSDAADE